VHGELAETLPVNGVATGHFVGGSPTAEQVFLTDGAVAPVLARLAIVILVQGHVDAHATLVAVLEIVPTTDAAKTTVMTMVGLFVGTHPKVANVAMILTKPDVTIDTVIGFAALSCIAFAADDFTDSEPVNGVVIIFWLGCAHGREAAR
jgi:hypothetical protein